ncbi:MAG: multidrug effflux MFS transporter [Geminicoccaceae bacterium]|nr:multidrug effflux MFS transporter [Geminicoccaceae bacterium]MCB9944787.1 multidrug effflux MFS transporter [Geminicoccaceae bacterium]
MQITDTPSSSSIRLVFVLVVATALGPFSMQIFLPALPAIQADFGVSAATAQLVFSLSGIAMAVATLFYGPISDAIGRRITMIAGLVVFLVGSAICVVAPNIHVLIAGRVIQAAGGVAGMVLSRVIIRDIYSRDEAATAIAYVTMAMVVAPMLAPTLGGYIVAWTVWPVVFVVSGLVGLPVLLATLRQLVETRSHDVVAGSVRSILHSFAILMRNHLFIAYTAQAAFSMSVFFGFLAAAPYAAITLMGLPVADYGLMFIMISAAFMGGNFLSARIGVRVAVDTKITIGALGTLAGTASSVLLLLLLPWSPWSVFVPMAATAFFQGMAMPNSQAAVVSVKPEIGGAASGLAGFVQLTMASLVAQTLGSLQWGTPYPMAFGLLVCAGAMTFFAFRARSMGQPVT